MKTLRFLYTIKFVFMLLILPVLTSAQSAKRDSFYVANWNLENLFDTDDDSTKNDNEFLPQSKKNWNVSRFDQKLNHLAMVINYMNGGCGPDIISVEEVENIMVMKKLCYKFDRDYVACHRDSPDERGIDVGLIYDRNVFTADSIAAIHVKIPSGKPTRDILHVILIHKKTGNKINVYVNHWPSRIGGEEKSEPNRIAAAEVLKSSLDTLFRTSPGSQVIILGDFNDNPDNKSIVETLGAKGYDCKEKPKSEFLDLAFNDFENGKGSYLYNGKFDMIDQIMLSKNLIDKKGIVYSCGSFEIIKPPFMISHEGKRDGGAIPTYIGNRYIGGFSDHFPVGAKFFVKGK